MTPTEQGRRSDALYYDGETVHRRDLCEMVAHREADIDALRDLCRDMWPRASFCMNERTTREFERRLRRCGVIE